MAGDKPGPRPRPKTEDIRMVVSAELYAYLGWLSRNTILGNSENEVARYLLTQRLEAMIASKYHETKPPKD